MSDSDSDFEDPLFGIRERVSRPKRRTMRTTNIMDALREQARKNDQLGADLGFKISEKEEPGTKRIRLDLVEVESKIERTRNVQVAVGEFDRHVSEREAQTLAVETFLRDNLWKGYIEDSANTKEVERLRKTVLESIVLNDPSIVPKRFKFWVSKGSPSSGFLQLDSIEAVEDYEGEVPVLELDQLLLQLGCDVSMIHNGPQVKFDRMEPLPQPLGMQVLKLALIMDNLRAKLAKPFDNVTLIKTLVLMSMDENLDMDLARVHYHANKYTGRQLVVLLAMEQAQMHPCIFLDTLSELFEFDPDLWAKAISGLYIVDPPQKQLQLPLLSKMILQFVVENSTPDGLNFRFDLDLSPVETFYKFALEWSKCKLQAVTPPPFSLVLQKMQALERVYLLNQMEIKAHSNAALLSKSFERMKAQYFAHHAGALAPAIPKAKAVLEYISGDLMPHSITDFFTT